MSIRTDGAISNAAGTGPATFTKQWASKAFLRFDGTGTIAISNSKNVSSITDIGTGRTQVNLTSSFATSAYTAVASARPGGALFGGTETFLAGSFEASSLLSSTGAFTDSSIVNAMANGDLA